MGEIYSSDVAAVFLMEIRLDFKKVKTPLAPRAGHGGGPAVDAAPEFSFARIVSQR
jgi:hypothetical protein